MTWFIGIDGGGTQTRAVIANPSGAALGVGRSGSSNHHSVGIERAAEAIVEAVTAAKTAAHAHGFASGAFFGLAGVRTPEDHFAFRRPLALLNLVAKPELLALDHDLRIALAGGLSAGPGIVVIAGTGSAGYGRDPDGCTAIAGGWGWVLDDQGGGTWIAMHGLRAVMEAADGRGPSTRLEPALFAELGVSSARDAMTWVLRPDTARSQLAALAPVVMAAAEDGDGMAQAIVREGARQLARVVVAVDRRLVFGSDNVSVVPAGGLLRGEFYRSALAEALAAAEPRARLLTEPASPIAGAVMLAAELAGTPLSHAAQARLATETRALG